MCEIDSDIHFCTCTDVQAFEEDFSGKAFLLWSLHRYLGTYDAGLDGILMPPQSMLNIGLDADFILSKLNSDEDLFDFNYTPNQGDNLSIKEVYIKGGTSLLKLKKRFKRNEYARGMSFLFKDGIWVEDYYDSFIVKTQEFKKGHLEKR